MKKRKMFAKPKIKVRMRRKSWRKTTGSSVRAGFKRHIREKEKKKMKIEIITGGWCKGDKIVDDIIIDRRAGKPAFQSKFNAEAVEQLRRHGLTQEVSE